MQKPPSGQIWVDAHFASPKVSQSHHGSVSLLVMLRCSQPSPLLASRLFYSSILVWYCPHASPLVSSRYPSPKARQNHFGRHLPPALGVRATRGERSRSARNSRLLDAEGSRNPGVSGPGEQMERLARHWHRAG